MVIASRDETPSSADIKALVEAGYDHVAPAYLAFSIRQATTSARQTYLDKFLTRLPASSKILELGCGAGILCTQSLIEHGHNVTGVDISSAQIALAKQNVPTATLIHSDMMSLDFAPGSFDAVVAFYSIFHLPKEEQGTMIRKIGGWLRVGGWFMCNFGMQEGEIYREDWMGATMFSSGWGARGNSEMVMSNGLEVGLRVVEDEIVGERVGSQEEKFQWVLATKGGGEV